MRNFKIIMKFNELLNDNKIEECLKIYNEGELSFTQEFTFLMKLLTTEDTNKELESIFYTSLLKTKCKLNILSNFLILYSSTNGWLKSVKYLMTDDIVNPSTTNNSALLGACENGHINVVKQLLLDKRVFPANHDSSAIHVAYDAGNYDICEFLIKIPEVSLLLHQRPKEERNNIQNAIMQYKIQNKIEDF